MTVSIANILLSRAKRSARSERMSPLAPAAQDWRGLQPESHLLPCLAGTPPPFQNGRLFAEMGVVAVATDRPEVTLGPRRSLAEVWLTLRN